jgi:hypothetical protein
VYVVRITTEKDVVRQFMNLWRRAVPATLALDDGAAARFIGRKLVRIVTSAKMRAITSGCVAGAPA